MNLDVTSTTQGAAVVVTPVGEIDVWSADRLRQALNEAEAAAARDVVVDLSGVSFLDSTGIGVLVGGLRRQKERGCTLGLVVNRPHLMKVLTITSLDRVFPIHATVADALADLPSTTQAGAPEAGGAGAQP